MRHTALRTAESVLAAVLFALPTVAGDEKPRAPRYPPARGFGYLGAFFVTNVDTTVSIFSERIPLGARIDLNRDLGFSNSQTVPRAQLGWTFGRRHLLAGGWYDLTATSVKVLSIDIPLPPGEEFPIDARVEATFETEIYKVQYTWLFHDDPKVSLGLGAGLFISGIGLTLDGAGPRESRRFDESVTAPLPVVGGRLAYRLTPRARVLATADWFFVKYGDYAGVLGDFQVLFAHRTFRHVGFAGGLNFQSAKVEYRDDELLWEIDQGFVGYLAALTFYF